MVESLKSRIALVEQDEECTPDIIKIARVWPVSGNTSLVITEEGLVIVDTGVVSDGPVLVEKIRKRTQAPFHTIIYTHGHGDHAGGVGAFLEDAQQRGHPKPRIIAHELVPARFRKYTMLAGHRANIGAIQFRRGRAQRPPQFYYPDITYADAMQFRLGGLTFELYHAKGETDDGTWVWIPERKTAIVGDLLIGGVPNVGNPLKGQRYALEWAEALERIAGKNPEFLIFAAGPVLRGEEIQDVCLDTAKYLRYIQDEVVRLMNEGCWLEEILERVKVPEELANKFWLRPNYGHPTFIVHGVYRRYAGWFNGNFGELFPSKSADIAAEVARLAGSDRLLERAQELRQSGDIQLALHLVDFVAKGTTDAGKRKAALLLKAELLDARADTEPSMIARNIFRSGADATREEANAL